MLNMNYSKLIKTTVLSLVITFNIGCSVKQGQIKTKTGVYNLEVKKFPGKNQDPIIYGTIQAIRSDRTIKIGFVRVDHKIIYKADTTGKFKFSVKPGRHHIEGNSIGYNYVNLKTFNLVPGDSIKIDFHLNVTRIWLE